MKKEWKIEPWNTIHSILILCATLVAILFDNLSVMAYIGVISFTSFIALNFIQLSKMSPFGGYANWATGFRLVLFTVFLFSFIDYENRLVCFILINAMLASDLLDGYLARQYKQETRFGQFFDMEVDAFWVCGMCIYYFLYHQIGWWILIPGVLRYAYKIFMIVYPKKDFQEKRKKYAAYIAGSFFVILAVAIVLDGFVQEILLAIGAAMICFSFAISTIEYLKY